MLVEARCWLVLLSFTVNIIWILPNITLNVTIITEVYSCRLHLSIVCTSTHPLNQSSSGGQILKSSSSSVQFQSFAHNTVGSWINNLISTFKPVLSGHSKNTPKIGFQYQLSLNAGQKYCRMEHSAILSTFIKLPFSIKTFVLSIFKWLIL